MFGKHWISPTQQQRCCIFYVWVTAICYSILYVQWSFALYWSPRGLINCTQTKAWIIWSCCQTPWWCPSKPDRLWSSRRCPIIIQLEACRGRTPITWIHQIRWDTVIPVTDAVELAAGWSFWRQITAVGFYGWTLHIMNEWMDECNCRQFNLMIFFCFIHQRSAVSTVCIRSRQLCLCLVWNIDSVDWMCSGDRWQGWWTTWSVLHSTQRFDFNFSIVSEMMELDTL